MITYGSLGDMKMRKYVSLRDKAKKAYKDPDRVNFKSQAAYEKHERTESKEEDAAERKAAKMKRS